MLRAVLVSGALLCFLALPVQAEQVLRVALAAYPPSKGNTHSDAIDYLPFWSALFDPLTMVSSDGDLMPWLAESWQQEDEQTWIFKLRPGVSFSNGEPFTARAVKESVEYLIGTEGQALAVGAFLTDLEAVEIIDPLTARVRTKVPSPMLPYDLQIMRIPEPDAWSTLGADGFASAPVGTGPFELVEWTPSLISMRARPQSWRPPKVDGLELSNVRDATARLTGLVTDRFDVIMSVDPDSFSALQAAGAKYRRNRVPAAIAIMFNTVGDKRLADPRVRQAMNYAVNKQAIIDVLFSGVTEPATQPAPRAAVGYKDDIEPYPYDPDKARALLAEAGFPDGFSFTMDLADGSSLNKRVHQQVASDLAKVGLEMTINQITRFRYLSNFQDGNWEGSVFPAGFFAPDLDALAIMQYGSCLRPFSWYCDPEIVPDIEAAMAEPNIERRTTLVEGLMQYGHDTAQGLFLYEAASFTGLAARVEGYETHGPFVLYENVRLTP